MTHLSPDAAKLLVKAILLFNDKKRFTLRRGGIDSFALAADMHKFLVAHGYPMSFMDPDLQPPPRNLRK
jgi:hypothetical protein